MLTKAWVESAPTPPDANGHMAPTAKNFVVTMAPKAPELASRATIDHVMFEASGLKRLSR